MEAFQRWSNRKKYSSSGIKRMHERGYVAKHLDEDPVLDKESNGILIREIKV